MEHRIYAITCYNRGGKRIKETFFRVYTPKMCAEVIAAYARKGIETIVDYGGPRTSFMPDVRHQPFTWRFHAYGRIAYYWQNTHEYFVEEAIIALNRR